MKLFTKTWANDFAWLKLAATSVKKLCQEPIDWKVVCDDGTKEEVWNILTPILYPIKSDSLDVITNSLDVIEVSAKWPEAMQIQSGYMRQQWVKMNAHRVMGNDLFWNWDSDVIAVKPFNSKNFCNPQGRPIHFFTQLNHLLSTEKDPTAIQAHTERRIITRQVLDYPHVCFEYMRCMPAPLFGEILSHASKQPDWNRAYEIMKKGDHRLSEFNIIGQFNHLYFPDAFEWKNTENGVPTWSGGYVLQGEKIIFQDHAFVAQGWSWAGIPAEVQKFVDELGVTVEDLKPVNEGFVPQAPGAVVDDAGGPLDAQKTVVEP